MHLLFYCSSGPDQVLPTHLDAEASAVQLIVSQGTAASMMGQSSPLAEPVEEEVKDKVTA